MPYEKWEDAVKSLQELIGPADDEQRALAESLGVKLPKTIPALVAAVMLREAMAWPLREGPPLSPTYGQAEYLQDLLDATGEKPPRAADTKERLSAWLTVLEAKRAIKTLRELRPRPGDVVSNIYDSKEVWTVASISGSGRINLAGHGRRGIAPERLKVEARAADSGGKAQHVRRRAANQSASRAPQTYPSAAKLALLEPFKITERATRAEIELLRNAVATAEDERPIQDCIRDHPGLLVALISSSLGRFVRPKVSLGGNKIPDFAIAGADSIGVHWTLIELESPRAPVAKKDGTLADKAREAVQQIEDWREWLQSNLDFARRPRDENGLALPDVRPESAGLVLIGRRGDLPAARSEVRRRLIEQRQITVHSYDWLLDAVEAGISPQNRPGSPLDWPDWVSEDGS